MSKENHHNHGVASNTDDVFRTFVGEKVLGILHGFEFGHDKVILVFECGWGLAFNNNGSHWVENPEEIEKLKQVTKKQLEKIEKEMRDILRLSGN